MTDHEKTIIQAYTGYVMLTGDKLGLVYKYIEGKLGRPIMTHELASKEMESAIRDAVRQDFIALCQDMKTPLSVVDARNRVTCWIEFWPCADDEPTQPALFVSLCEGDDQCVFTTEYDDSLDLDLREYGITWRCWADKPTNEERTRAEWIRRED